MSFGPLNKEGGLRRFNVAITRAERQTKLRLASGGRVKTLCHDVCPAFVRLYG